MEIILALLIGIIIGSGACYAVIRSRNTVPQGTQEQIRDAVRASAAQAFQENNVSFLSLANERLGTTMESAKSEFKQRHEQFQSLVKPLTEDYRGLDPQIKQLIQQNSTLTTETNRLAGALTNNRQIGSWGEVQLRRVAELAGMTDYCDFAEQEAIGSGERPDMKVNLPEQRTIIVDAKASTAAYLEAQQLEDETQGQEALRRHAGALRAQVDELARKDYGSKEPNSLDFVVMFVPGDQFLAAALSQEPGLVEYAMGKRVAIATPASLISLMWAVANGWQRHRIARDAEEIRKVGEEMHKRLMTFMGHYQAVGKELDSAVAAYNRSIGSFDRQLVPQGRKFAGLVQHDEDLMPEPAQLEGSARISRYAEDPRDRIREDPRDRIQEDPRDRIQEAADN